MKPPTPLAIEIYESYPRRVKRPLAIRAILKAIERDGYEHVRDRTAAYAERAADKDMQFIPHPATFFNQEIYNDDLDAIFPAPRPQSNGKPIPKSLSDKIGDEMVRAAKRL